MSFGLYGRRMIKSDETEVTVENVVAILNKALPYHWENRSEIQYLWYYYRGLQPILNREKQVRPEICNKIVENRANEIVSFKSGYLMGEPLQYVSRGSGDNLSDAINQLNEFVFAEEKPAKDKELADWFHICGTSFRMVLPDEDVGEMTPRLKSTHLTHETPLWCTTTVLETSRFWVSNMWWMTTA